MAYFCQNCGYKSVKWLGRCPECGEWNTFLEEVSEIKKGRSAPKVVKGLSVKKLSEFEGREEKRIKTGIEELDRVLGGGIVPGALVLIGGDPGIGKSTLLLQMAESLSLQGFPVCYVSGEESPFQVKLRAERLGLKSDFFFLGETNLNKVLGAIEEISPKFLIVDSIQTMFLEEIASSPGGVSQIRECTNVLMRLAKEKEISVFIIGHITKSGAIAGPKVLEHLVDVVLFFEGEKFTDFRILRAVKNRFGPLNEIGIFVMTEKGLVSHENYEDIFLTGEGGAIFCIVEGVRPILVEAQSLVSKSYLSIPRRTAVGFDPTRLSLIVAILEKRLGFKFFDQDIYLKISGGLKIFDPGADFAVAVSLISNLINKSLPEKSLFIGELGLLGEIKPVRDMGLRLKEAEKKGLKEAFIPKMSFTKDLKRLSLTLHPVKYLKEVLEIIF